MVFRMARTWLAETISADGKVFHAPAQFPISTLVAYVQSFSSV